MIDIQETRRNKHFYAEEHSGVCVVRHEGESDDNLIRRFRKKCSRSGISNEIKQRMYFEKPSNRRRRKKAQSIRYKEKEDKKLEEMRERARIKRFKLNRKKSKGVIQND